MLLVRTGQAHGALPGRGMGTAYRLHVSGTPQALGALHMAAGAGDGADLVAELLLCGPTSNSEGQHSNLDVRTSNSDDPGLQLNGDAQANWDAKTNGEANASGDGTANGEGNAASRRRLDVNAAAAVPKGATPLILAARAGDELSIQILLHAHADVCHAGLDP